VPVSEQETAAVLDALRTAFGQPILDPAFHPVFAKLVQDYSGPSFQDLKDRIRREFHDVAYVDNRLGLDVFLLRILGGQDYLQRIVSQLDDGVSLSRFSEIFWTLMTAGFVDPAVGALDFDPLREKYQALRDRVLARLTLQPRLGPNRAIRKLAILSPQLLGLQHSPSREAVNMALTLANTHGVDAYIFNTNTMNYTNDANLPDPPLANTNPEFKGAMRLQTRYGGFADPTFKVISFEPGRLTFAKLQSIAGTVLEIAPDAIISHGENHFVQDMFYGRIPSIFATTGQVIPFARSDAYWAPGSLVNDEHDRVAERFGHGRILREAMFTTPSDVDVAPAERAAFGLAPDHVVFLAVGGRLAQEIDAGFAEACIRILDANPHAVLLFAGPNVLNLEALFGPEEAARGRMINLGFRDDLPAITRMSDVYLNPRRAGGGTSAQTALFAGLPVVTLEHGHVSDVLDPASRRQGWDDYVAYAARLANDAALRREEASRQLEALRRRSDSAAQIARLLGYLTDIRGDYLARA
jgi:hypothetical protein